MKLIIKWLTHAAEAISAAMLAAMFATFLIQIFSRYVLQDPFGWTLELCLTLWIWIVFFGNAFIVRKQDHVTFDLFYQMAPSKVQRVFALASAAAIVVAMAWAFLPTADYIDWMKIRKSATLKIPMRTVFSIYLVFMAAVIARYAWKFVSVWRNGVAKEDERVEEQSL